MTPPLSWTAPPFALTPAKAFREAGRGGEEGGGRLALVGEVGVTEIS